MTPKQSERRLRQLLREAGLTRTRADAATVLAVYKQFVAEPVRGEEGPLLFQAETAEECGEWSLDFVRGYKVRDAAGAEDKLTLHIELNADAEEDLRIPQTSLISWDYPTTAKYFEALEASAAYRGGLAHPKWRLQVYMG